MIGFLLAISMILTILALFAIVVLYLRQNRLFEVEKRQEKMIRDMEEVISTYLYEMKEDNEEFIKRIQQLNIVPKQSADRQNLEPKPRQDEPTKNKTNDVSENLEPLEKSLHNRVGKTKSYQAVKAYKKTSGSKQESVKEADQPILPPAYKEEETVPEIDERTAEELYMKSLYQQALLLEKQGMSVEEIAKNLNKGKTEIELLLKFRQNG